MDRRPLHTVVETPEFQRRVTGRLSRHEVGRFIDYIAANPDDGDPMTGTGGARKVRWAARGKGKSRWHPRHHVLQRPAGACVFVDRVRQREEIGYLQSRAERVSQGS